MKFLRDWTCTAIILLLGFCAALFTTACSSQHPTGAVGNFGTYNYSPSAIQIGDTRELWWCSQGVNPNQTSQDTDSIFFESINMVTHESFGPVLVLAETPGAWDSAYTCNPQVIGGVFANPLGDGTTYSLAMYYVGTAETSGENNSIGVAFSNDGISWKKYPQPIIPSTSQAGYGVGQPIPYNGDHQSAITLLYEDDTPTTHHLAAVSPDGVHFTFQGALTADGLDPDDPQPIWGDIAYEPNAGEWYAVFNRPLRPKATTGGVAEWGQYGVELYKIKQNALLTGTSPWQRLVEIDTNSTGFESNFIPGMVRDFYGNIDLSSDPNIEMYVSTSYPQTKWDATPAEAGASAAVQTWILMPFTWSPVASESIPLNRYFNGSVHEVTTGWVSPDASFQMQGALGSLYQNPSQGANVPFYGCKKAQTDYFVSLDVACEGQRILGKQGYAFAQPVSGLNLVGLYRCSTTLDHFVSQDPKCEGQTTDELLGYVVAP
jgi:hypothetical protein